MRYYDSIFRDSLSELLSSYRKMLNQAELSAKDENARILIAEKIKKVDTAIKVVKPSAFDFLTEKKIEKIQSEKFIKEKIQEAKETVEATLSEKLKKEIIEEYKERLTKEIRVELEPKIREELKKEREEKKKKKKEQKLREMQNSFISFMEQTKEQTKNKGVSEAPTVKNIPEQQPLSSEIKQNSDSVTPEVEDISSETDFDDENFPPVE